jgi:hypothetical protein
LLRSKRILLATALLLTGTVSGSGQRVSFGVVGGTNLTHDFPANRGYYLDADHPTGNTAVEVYSDTHSFFAGLSVEFGLGKDFSLEADALHRNLNLEQRFLFPDGQMQEGARTSVVTWEWPVLIKYRLPARRMQPFLEVGPSFRTRDNPAPTEPSPFGATVGAGMEFHLWRLRLSPAIRYTRWQYDGPFPRTATKRDQIEFLTGVSYPASPALWGLHGRKIGIGLTAGAPLTGGLNAGSRAATSYVSESQGYMAGLVVEVEVMRGLGVEVDGLYRPLRAHNITGVYRQEFTVLTWQFPVLAKHRLRTLRGIGTVVEAGPSFRLSGNRNGYDPSAMGFTGGAGVERRFGTVTVGPVLRYTRWAQDPSQKDASPGNAAPATTNRNQLEVLASLSF